MNPFRALDVDAAWRYEGWYRTAAGGAVASAEQGALASALARFPAAHTILEAGCGTGFFTRWFASAGLTAVGIDTAPGMLRVAAEDGSGCYVRADAARLPLPDQSVDLVSLITTLEFLPGPLAALQDAARVARQGLVLGVLNQLSPLGVTRRVGAWLRPSMYRAAQFFTGWSLERLVRRALGRRAEGMWWTTAVWPRWTPTVLRRLPCGAFIAMAVPLHKEEGTRWRR
jgi:ubiquinone/menaquinone biosynthesis C-methylase UbiE